MSDECEVAKYDVFCPECGLEVQLVVRSVEVKSGGNGVVTATIEASSFKHRCKQLGGKF